MVLNGDGYYRTGKGGAARLSLGGSHIGPLQRRRRGGAIVLIECKASRTVTPQMAVSQRQLGAAMKRKRGSRTTMEMLLVHQARKAVAELVENSIDAKARTVTITRGREHGRHFFAIRDDGEGVPRDADGRPDFRYVATHICDSIKRSLKADGASGLQGEFGIGLLSFWTLGEELTMASTGADQRPYQMVMRKGDPGYEMMPRRALFADAGTEVRIAPLLDGIRTLSG